MSRGSRRCLSSCSVVSCRAELESLLFCVQTGIGVGR